MSFRASCTAADWACVILCSISDFTCHNMIREGVIDLKLQVKKKLVPSTVMYNWVRMFVVRMSLMAVVRWCGKKYLSQMWCNQVLREQTLCNGATRRKWLHSLVSHTLYIGRECLWVSHAPTCTYMTMHIYTLAHTCTCTVHELKLHWLLVNTV